MRWDPGLARDVIAVERLHAAVPAGALASSVPAPSDSSASGPAPASVALPELAEHPWILAGPRSHFGRSVRLACQAAGFEPTIKHEVGEQATALAMVAAGLGVTLVSDLGLMLCPSGVDVVALTEPVMRTVSIAYRTGNARLPSLRVVIDAVRAAAAEQGLGAQTPVGSPTPGDPPDAA
jgi:DNA-binding transcriptional LysR family regulator